MIQYTVTRSVKFTLNITSVDLQSWTGTKCYEIPLTGIVVARNNVVELHFMDLISRGRHCIRPGRW